MFAEKFGVGTAVVFGSDELQFDIVEVAQSNVHGIFCRFAVNLHVSHVLLGKVEKVPWTNTVVVVPALGIGQYIIHNHGNLADPGK